MKAMLVLLLLIFAAGAPAEESREVDCPCEEGERVAETEASARCAGEQLLEPLRASEVAGHDELADRLEKAMEGEPIPGFVGAWRVSEEGNTLFYFLNSSERFRVWLEVGVACEEGHFRVERAIQEHHAWAERER